MRMLLVEDEPAAARMLAKGLREHAYAGDVAGDGEDASFRLLTADCDAVILDVMLPRRDGVSVAREARAAGLAVPILMLPARDAVEARIAGLDSGADDYLTKPFDFGELLARLRADPTRHVPSTSRTARRRPARTGHARPPGSEERARDSLDDARVRAFSAPAS